MSKRFAIALVVAASVAATTALTAGAEPRPADSCTNVSGTVSAVGIPVFGPGGLEGFNVIGTGATGPLGGAVTASLVIEQALPGGTLHLSGTHSYPVSPVGPLTFSDSIVVTPSGRVRNTAEVVSGGSGFLATWGTIDLMTGAIELTYQGRICSA
jgi:hypothetical protein